MAASSSKSVGKRVEARLARLVESARAGVLLGPWPGDVRAELLYWIPFLRWVVSRFQLDPATTTASSREDASSWYREIAAAFVEASGSDPAGQYPPAAVISPAVLSELFGGYWNGEYPIAHVLRYTRVVRLEPSSDDTALRDALPEGYLALGGVFDSSVPETRGNVEALKTFIGNGRGRSPVVPLSSPGAAPWRLVEELATDPHRRLLERLPTRGSPSELSTIAAGASAVIGTPGSDAVALGVCCGTRTLALYADPRDVSSTEVDLLTRTARAVGSSFAVVNLAHASDLARLGAGQDD